MPTNTQILEYALAQAAERARSSMMPFTLFTNPTYTSGWFNELLCAELDQFLKDMEDGKNPRLMVFAPPRSGKLLAHDTLVPTPNGYVPHGNLQPGDFVFAPDGSPVRVIGTSEENLASVKVTFTNGQSIVCHPNHEWTFYDRVNRRWRTEETSFFMQHRLFDGVLGSRGAHYRYQLQNTEAFEYEEKELVVPPYVLGAWLGDGSRSKPAITHAAWETEVINGIVDAGYKITTQCVHPTTGVITTYFSGTTGVAGPLARGLFEIGVYTAKGQKPPKHIPEIYLRSSKTQRLELLAGLIDTDGTTDKKSRMTYTSCERPLIDTVYQLVESLGMRPYIVEHQPRVSTSGIVGKKVYWTVGFQPTMHIPCRLERKRAKRLVAQRRIAICKIETVDPVPGKCIQVANSDGLYLVGKDRVVTHNSELASRRFPAYALGKHPKWNVISASYSADLADRMSRDCQRIIDSDQYHILFPDTCLGATGTRNGAIRTAELWEVTDSEGHVHGGAYRSAGVGGGITGQGFNLGIIDDPAKDYAQASSATYQESVMDWFDTTFMTRRDPQLNGVIIIMTRWHVKDLAGQLLAREPDKWRIVSFPMEAECDEVHTLGDVTYNLRKKGEILFPERMPQTFVDECKKAGSLTWNALYQQRPTIKGGGILKSQWFGEYSVLPKIKQSAIFADTALKTKEANDFSVFEHWGLGVDGNLYLIDLLRGKWDSDELKRRVTAFWVKAKANPEYHLTKLFVEDKASGTGLIQQLQRGTTPRIPVVAVQRGTDKLTRFMSVQGYIESGYVKLPREATWLSDFLMECEGLTAAFKNHDDQIDPMMDAIGHYLDKPRADLSSWV